MMSTEYLSDSSRYQCIKFAGSRFVVFRSAEASATVWDLDGKKEHGKMEWLPGGQQVRGRIESSHNGSSVASLTSHGTNTAIKLWSMDPFRCMAEFTRPPQHSDYATAFALLGDGKAILGTIDGQLEVWDLSQGQTAAVLPTIMSVCWRKSHTGAIQVVKSGPSAPSAVLSGSLDKTIKLWDLRSDSCVRTMEVGYSVTSMGMDANARVALSNEGIRTAKLWDLGSGKCLSVVSDPDKGPGSFDIPRVAMQESGEAFLCRSGSCVTAWHTSCTSQPIMKAATAPVAGSSAEITTTGDFSRVGLAHTLFPKMQHGDFRCEIEVWT